jgi:competence protein ComGF
VALLVISGTVLVIEAMTRLAAQEIARSQNSSEKDWQIFCSQLRSELDRTKLDKVENNFLYVEAGKNKLRFGLPSKATDFRKTNSEGQGYQPMLHGIRSAQITLNQGIVTINLQMITGGEKQFYYRFSENAVEEESSSTP